MLPVIEMPSPNMLLLDAAVIINGAENELSQNEINQRIASMMMQIVDQSEANRRKLEELDRRISAVDLGSQLVPEDIGNLWSTLLGFIELVRQMSEKNERQIIELRTLACEKFNSLTKLMTNTYRQQLNKQDTTFKVYAVFFGLCSAASILFLAKNVIATVKVMSIHHGVDGILTRLLAIDFGGNLLLLVGSISAFLKSISETGSLDKFDRILARVAAVEDKRAFEAKLMNAIDNGLPLDEAYENALNQPLEIV